MVTARFEEGVDGYFGTIDTKLKQVSPNTSYGTAMEITTNFSQDSEEQILLAFTNLFGSDPGQIPLGAIITSATLTLQTTDKSNQGGALYRMIAAWSESSTWNSLGNGIQLDDVEAAASPDVVTGPTVVGSRDFDVTSSVASWASGAANYGWVFKGSGTDSWKISSSEGSIRPVLTVNYTLSDTPPPPTPPVVSIFSGTPNPQTEGAGAQISFTITLDKAATSPVTVSYATVNGTALAGSDFVGVDDGSITFDVGETSKTITVDLLEDTTSESTETFGVKIVSAANASVSSTDNTATGTIVDNDTPSTGPVVSISSASPNPQIEGPNTKIKFTLTLSEASTQTVTVNYSTVDGTAKAGSDYVAQVNKTISFRPGETSKTITINLVDDKILESAEFFSVKINSAANATVSTENLTGTADIVDDDLPATVVKIYDTTQYKLGDPSGYGSGDPSGLAYVPGTGGRPGTLFIADSEHDETPYFSATNLLGLNDDGSFNWYSMRNFTKEPTGLAYNPVNKYLYITDDDKGRIFWVDPLNPSVKIGEINTAALGLSDTEDPAFDEAGNLYFLDGISLRLHGISASGHATSIALPTAIGDVEALAYSHTTSDGHAVFFVAGGTKPTIFMIDDTGQLLGSTNVLSSYTSATGLKPAPKGLTMAPSSDPTDGNTMNLFVADYGADQKNDGRIFEIDLASGWLVA
ncbi:hypothetical protein DC522_28680 [Microvirga sp. KLBC 81]|uniref:Calx-beta domain-containing protein n=1 Tax=Microvirga sp. KLBC 81 TaxID=1862707 RepID=UPI000D51C29D|nr:Calx-beta domain-containing protein [Microvirga sp. KLBC 81]PVE21057.1 hypothetical protein DC522_28680 [Microvirga sp. KLBC 81]